MARRNAHFRRRFNASVAGARADSHRSRRSNRRDHRPVTAAGQLRRGQNHRWLHCHRFSRRHFERARRRRQPKLLRLRPRFLRFPHHRRRGNGCDVRDDVLARDLTDITYKYAGSCVVESGTLPIRTPLRPSILYVAAPPAPKCRSTMWWPLKTLGNPVRATGPLPNAMNSAMTPTTCWPSTPGQSGEGVGFRRLLATHQRRLPLRLRGPPDWRQRQVPAHRHLPRKGRHARRPPHLPGPGRARRRIGLPLRMLSIGACPSS